MKIETKDGKYHILIPIEYGYEETVVESMDFKSAHLSGNRIRRVHPRWGTEFGKVVDNDTLIIQYGILKVPLSLKDILADDWEVEEEKVTVTKNQVEEAYRAFQQFPDYDDSLSPAYEFKYITGKGEYVGKTKRELILNMLGFKS